MQYLLYKERREKREPSQAEEYNNDKEYLPSSNPKKALNQSVEFYNVLL